MALALWRSGFVVRSLVAQIRVWGAQGVLCSDECWRFVGVGYPLELVAGLRTLECPMSVMTDSYKAGHYLMYPESKSMTAYGEFREPFPGMDDNRFIVSEIR